MERLPVRLKATRGSLFSLDFNISNSKGDPFMIYKEDTNPRLIFTVSAARYKENGEIRDDYWVDLENQFVVSGGSLVGVPAKKFASTEAFYTDDFIYVTIAAHYPDIFSDNPADNNYYGNYLFYTTTSGKKEYKYYNGEDWVGYNFRIVQHFDTKNWVEQTYLLQIKYTTGVVENDEYIVTKEIVLLNEAIIDVASDLQGGK